MLYPFPVGTTAKVIAGYNRPYPDPITVRAGEPVVPDAERTRQTDFMGWTWCTGPDGRGGWVPDGWIDRDAGGWRMRRGFSALELTVQPGEVVALECSESGFVRCRDEAGHSGWLPDAILELITVG